MKKNLLSLIFFLTGLSAYCQPVVKSFVFEQEISPGTKPSGARDENGNEIKKAAAKKNYFVFLSFAKKYSVRPTQLFINKKAFSVATIEARKPPVEYIDSTVLNNPEKIILVPATKNKVVEIKFVEIKGHAKRSSYAQKLTNANAVVVVYSWKNKKYYATSAAIKKLKPSFQE